MTVACLPDSPNLARAHMRIPSVGREGPPSILISYTAVILSPFAIATAGYLLYEMKWLQAAGLLLATAGFVYSGIRNIRRRRQEPKV